MNLTCRGGGHPLDKDSLRVARRGEDAMRPAGNGETGAGISLAGAEDLAKEFEPFGQTIRNWVQQADRDDGLHHDGLTSQEWDELRRLRRENKQLREEREILSKAAAWFAKEADSTTRKRSGS